MRWATPGQYLRQSWGQSGWLERNTAPFGQSLQQGRSRTAIQSPCSTPPGACPQAARRSGQESRAAAATECPKARCPPAWPSLRKAPPAGSPGMNNPAGAWRFPAVPTYRRGHAPIASRGRSGPMKSPMRCQMPRRPRPKYSCFCAFLAAAQHCGLVAVQRPTRTGRKRQIIRVACQHLFRCCIGDHCSVISAQVQGWGDKVGV